MKKTASYLILIVLIGLGIAGYVGYQMYNKPHADLASEQPDAVLSATELFSAYEADESTANAKYLDKRLEVNGTVQEISPTHDGGYVVVLKEADAMFGIGCSFLPDQADEIGSLKAGMEVTIRGICTGMLMDVNLVRCILQTASE
ncbi:OB-fold protein [Pontibacter sp. G13]|uniref:OB-fold protein n=1 Tax=Pontibacter sp. G13 TaxID=3074898 RepID=UPI00288A9697|nr:hypothetical protein [Pontibacter sp. G13]WNJ18115.1 hypothetical protein RJD25_24960 [Pontibacter sp. G13]